MRRFLIRLSALTAVVAMGLIAIAQAQRVMRGPAAPAAESDDLPLESSPGPIAATAPGEDLNAAPAGLIPPGSDPFAMTSSEDPSQPAEPVPYQDADPYGAPAEPGRLVADQQAQALPEPDPGNVYAVAPAGDASQPIPYAEPAYGQPTPAAANEPTPAEPPAVSESVVGPGPVAAEDPIAREPNREVGVPIEGGDRLFQRVPTAEERAPAEPVRYNDQPTPAAPPNRYAQPVGDAVGSVPDPAGPYRPAALASGQSPVSAIDRALPDSAGPVPGGAGAAPGELRMEGTGLPGPVDLEGLQKPIVSIEKLAPAELTVDQPATFEIVVRNEGSAAVHQVQVLDELPRGAELLATQPQATRQSDGRLRWDLETLGPDEEVVLEVELMPVAEGDVGSTALVTFAAEATVRTIATKPQLVIDVTSPDDVLIGEDLTLTIRLTNQGTGVAENVVLEDVLPANLEHPAGSELQYDVGDLAPDESRELELTLAAVKAGDGIVNLITARSHDEELASDEFRFDVLAPQLTLSIDGPRRRFLDRRAVYSFSVENPGTAAAQDIELVTRLPNGFQFVEADNYGTFSAESGEVRWRLEELPAGQSGTVTLTAIPTLPGQHRLTIEGTAELGLQAAQEQSITVEGVSAILFEVVDVEDPVEAGGETLYEIRVTNQGTKEATNVRVAAELPIELEPIDADGPTRHLIEGQLVSFDPLGRLAPKADTSYQIRARAMRAGDLRTRVRILTDEMQSPVTKEESTRVYSDAQ